MPNSHKAVLAVSLQYLRGFWDRDLRDEVRQKDSHDEPHGRRRKIKITMSPERMRFGKGRGFLRFLLSARHARIANSG
jgi:hypothetical protein